MFLLINLKQQIIFIHLKFLTVIFFPVLHHIPVFPQSLPEKYKNVDNLLQKNINNLSEKHCGLFEISDISNALK